MDMYPCSSTEEDFAHHSTVAEDVSMWGTLVGFRASSTRAEIAAGVVAATAPMAVHQATDSMSYYKKFQKIKEGKNLIRKRPWNLHKDGDLWELLYNIILGRGITSLEVSWCKGHAKQEHIDKGLSSPLLKLGNDMADVNATKGVEQHVEGLLQLACFYASKQGHYIKFVSRIHNMFMRVLHAEQTILEAADAHAKAIGKCTQGSERELVSVPASFSCPAMGQGSRMQLDKIKVGTLNGTMAQSYAAVWHFLALSLWKPTTEGRNGSSWMELFARFYSMGGDPQISEQKASLLRPEDSLKTQLRNFKNICRNILEVYARPGDQVLFRPAKHPAKRLRAYGIDKHVPCISAELCMARPVQEMMHECMARLTCTLNKQKLNDLHMGLLKVPLNKFIKLRGAPPWDNSSPKISLPQLVQRRHEHEMIEIEKNNKNRKITKQPLSFILACHKCGSQKECAEKHLIKKARWAAITCVQCKVARKASKWLCPCNLPWQTCTTHREEGFACKKPNKFGKKRGRNPRIGRVLPPLGSLEGCGPDPKRVRVENIVTKKSSGEGAALLMTGERGAEGQPTAHTQGGSGQQTSFLPIADLPSLRRQPDGLAGDKQLSRKRSKGRTIVGAQAKKPKIDIHKRSLPVAWGRDIFTKCPRLMERFSVFSQPRPPERGQHELGRSGD